jgi:hypothetical protein
MRFIQGTGVIPTLPKVPNAAGLAVIVLGVLHMDGSKDARHGVIGTGDADDMDVVRHEAISPDFEVALPGILGEPFQIAGVILRHGEDGLPVIAPLGDVMGITYCYGT